VDCIHERAVRNEVKDFLQNFFDGAKKKEWNLRRIEKGPKEVRLEVKSSFLPLQIAYSQQL
jgi:hypothetical protein